MVIEKAFLYESHFNNKLPYILNIRVEAEAEQKAPKNI